MRSLRKISRKVFFILVIIGWLFMGILIGTSIAEDSPPNLYTSFPVKLPLPEPIAPVGEPLEEGTESDALFEWGHIDKADAYGIWIKETNGRSIHKVLKVGKETDTEEGQVECVGSTCTVRGFNLTGREGQWRVQALSISGKERSGWSKSGIFGRTGDLYSRCVKPVDQFGFYGVEAGDLPWLRNDLSDLTRGEWTVGLAALAQVIKYDFAKKKAGLNNGLGAGASFRFYRDVYVPGEEKKVPISRIKSECRANTFQLRDETDIPEAAPVFSVTPVIFASQIIGEDNLKVEPAIMLGFFEDILNIGAGFNLTGKNGDVGDVFLLFSVGAGFNF